MTHAWRIADVLRRERVRQRTTRARVALRCGIGLRTLGRIEACERAASESELLRIAAALGVSLLRAGDTWEVVPC